MDDEPRSCNKPDQRSAAERELVKGRGGWRPQRKRKSSERTLVDVSLISPQPTEQEATALLDVVAEIVRTHCRAVSIDPLRRVSIVAEEAGEALREVLDYTRPDPLASAMTREQNRGRIRGELVQCAAAAIRAIGQMDWEEECRLSHKSIRANRTKKR